MDSINLDSTMSLSDVEFDDNDSSSTDKITRAYEFYASGRYSEAQNLVENDPRIPHMGYGQVLLGNCYKQLGNKEKAINCWKRAIDIAPLEYSAYINLANEQYSNGNINEAILNWHVACTIRPENPTVNLNLAVAYDKKNSRIKATKFFERYLRYETRTAGIEYVSVKRTMSNLKAQAEFYSKKLGSFKANRDIKGIAAVYLKMIATYANLPSVYNNIAEIFYFDKNYQKALEFYLLLYLNYPHSIKVLIEIANLCYILQHKSYSYVYYKRALDLLPQGTSHYSSVRSKMASLSSVLRDQEIIDSHLQKAQDAEKNNDYEVAIDEYENYLILTETENQEIQLLIDKYKIFANPEPFVINVLYNQIPDLMNKKKLNACVELCDRIMTLSTENTKEVVYAMKCKSECKRIIIAREQFGV